MDKSVPKKQTRNNENNRKHQKTYLSDPDKLTKHKERMKLYYENHKERLRTLNKDNYRIRREKNGFKPKEPAKPKEPKKPKEPRVKLTEEEKKLRAREYYIKNKEKIKLKRAEKKKLKMTSQI